MTLQARTMGLALKHATFLLSQVAVLLNTLESVLGRRSLVLVGNTSTISPVRICNA